MSSKGLDDVWAERCRHVNDEGWTPEHDDKHTRRELAYAASCYVRNAAGTDMYRRLEGKYIPRNWPWDIKWWKPTDRRRDLVKAGALIVAEIDRLDRLSAREDGR